MTDFRLGDITGTELLNSDQIQASSCAGFDHYWLF